MELDTLFWQGMGNIIAANRINIDRPKGSAHPCYPDLIYPLDYGYIENTTSADGSGMDVWMGSLNTGNIKTLTGILCTFDKIKRDAEIKLLLGCTKEDIHIIQKFSYEMLTLFIPNPLEAT